VAQQLGRPSPEDLARELRVVVKVGTRASRLVYRLDQIPELCRLTGHNAVTDKWDCAIAVCTIVQRALGELGNGPYGEAARILFGLHPGVLGLPLHRRREAAADLLDTSSSTFVRHREAEVVLDVACTTYLQCAER
jgi:hypothetical protein